MTSAKTAPKRYITVVSSNMADPKDIEISSVNWGDLKKELSAQGIAVHNMVGIVGETETAFTTDSSLLPHNLVDGEFEWLSFTLMLFQEKAKSAASDFEGMSTLDLRRAFKAAKEASTDPDFKTKYSLGSSPTREALINALTSIEGEKQPAKAKSKSKGAKELAETPAPKSSSKKKAAAPVEVEAPVAPAKKASRSKAEKVSKPVEPPVVEISIKAELEEAISTLNSTTVTAQSINTNLAAVIDSVAGRLGRILDAVKLNDFSKLGATNKLSREGIKDTFTRIKNKTGLR